MCCTAASGSVVRDRFEPVSAFISVREVEQVEAASVMRNELASVSRLEITVGSVRRPWFLTSR